MNAKSSLAVSIGPWASTRSAPSSWVYRTREEARSDVFDYIERFYNPVRKHSKLDFLSPVDFEQPDSSLEVAGYGGTSEQGLVG